MQIQNRISRTLTRVLATGAVIVAAALPLAVATEAGAAVIPASSFIHLSQDGFTNPKTPGADGSAAILGQGWSGTATITLNAADAAKLNGSGAALVSSTATGVTLGVGTESISTATQVTFTMAANATATPGYASVTVLDSAGSVTLANAIYIEVSPTITSVSPASVVVGSTVPVTVTGSGFVPGAVGQIIGASTIAALAYASPTTMTGTINATGAALGFYAIQVENGDGGTGGSISVGVTVTGPTITTVSPASLAVPGTLTTTTTLTITGTGFLSGAYVSLSSVVAGCATPTNQPTVGTTTFVSATSLTVPVTVASNFLCGVSTPRGQLDVVLHNGDGAVVTDTRGLGIGEAAFVTPTVTGVSTTLPLAVNGSSVSLLITGTGFGPAGTSDTATFNTAAGSDAHVVCGTPTVISDTQMSCLVATSTGSYTGPHSVKVTTAGGTSAGFANAVTVSGATITAVSPAVLPANFNGTLTVTGTGFTSGAATATAGGSVGGTATAVPTYVSATSFTVVVSGSSIAAGQSLILTLIDNSGNPTSFAVPVVNAPTVSSISYTGTTTGVGAGASAQPIVINGTGFLPGATVTFASASGITATVTTVTPIAISATVSVPAAAAVATYAVTVSNTTAGSTVTWAPGLNVQASPGASVAPTSVLAGATAAALTITGTGFTSGTTLKSNSPLVTFGTVTVVSATTITVPAAVAVVNGTVPVGISFTVTNTNGGTSTVALSVNPGVTITGVYYVPTFSTNYEISVTGTGFQTGMTAASANADYTVSVANVAASGQVVTLLVTTTAAATAGTSSAVTLTNLDGSKATFTLNGGPAPSTTPKPKITSIHGRVRPTGYSHVTVLGVGFYGQPRVTSSARGTRAVVTNDNGKAMVIHVTPKRGTRPGNYRLTFHFAHGEVVSAVYHQM